MGDQWLRPVHLLVTLARRETITMEPAFRPSADVPDPQSVAEKWWSANAKQYLAEHPSLGDVRFQWGPEGWTEEDLQILPAAPGRILEVGAGAAQCSRWLASKGHNVTASDISKGMLSAAELLNEKTGIAFPLIHSSIDAMPFGDSSFDTVFTSFGALSFIPDLGPAFAEVFRVLSPGGLWAYSVTHPFSWVFPDSPYTDDLKVIRPYGKREAYVNQIVQARPTQSSRTRFPITSTASSEQASQSTTSSNLRGRWPMPRRGARGVPDRGAMLPGTLIVSARRPAS